MKKRAASAAATRIAFIHSSWHKDIVGQGRRSFTSAISKLGIDRKCIDFFEVPGAFEIPLHAKLLAKSDNYDAIIACGFVVDGGIYRHEFVADAVIKALMKVQLETEVPVFSVVLTPHHFHEHQQHHDFFFRHFLIKGVEAAQACVRTLDSLKRIRSRPRADGN